MSAQKKASESGEGKALVSAVPSAPPAPISETAALISMLERAARDPTVDISKMERLFDLQQQAVARRAKTEFLGALAALQKVLPAVERKGTGHNSKKYARFEDFIGTVKEPMATHKFSLTFRIKQEQGSICITGVLGHEGGHQEETSLTLPADNTGNKNAVQALGSSVSYGKRYVGLTLLGIATEDEDDDGKAGGGKPAERITEKQVEELNAIIQKTPDPAATTQTVLMHWKVANITDLAPAQFTKTKAQLKDKFSL